jgi:hypothetical protein
MFWINRSVPHRNAIVWSTEWTGKRSFTWLLLNGTIWRLITKQTLVPASFSSDTTDWWSISRTLVPFTWKNNNKSNWIDAYHIIRKLSVLTHFLTVKDAIQCCNHYLFYNSSASVLKLFSTLSRRLYSAESRIFNSLWERYLLTIIGLLHEVQLLLMVHLQPPVI